MAELTHGLSGAAGEYFVCAELSIRGYIASLTIKSAEGIDVLATKPSSGRAISIQVKTIQGADRHWVMNEKHEHIDKPDLFYVFVRLLKVGLRPHFHVVPSAIVAAHVAARHQEWMARVKKDGSPRKDTSMRGFSDQDNLYLERWEILNREGGIRCTLESRQLGISPLRETRFSNSQPIPSEGTLKILDRAQAIHERQTE